MEAGDYRYFSAPSMLELKAMILTIETTEEVNLIPELTAADLRPLTRTKPGNHTTWREMSKSPRDSSRLG